MSKDTENSERPRQAGDRYELRAFLRKDENGEYLPPIGANVQVEIRRRNRITNEVVQDWIELGAKSLSFSVDAASILYAKVELPLVEVDLNSIPEPGTFDLPEGVVAETSEENL